MAGHVCIYPSLYVKSWNGQGAVPQWLTVMDAESALRQTWSTDAQFGTYFTMNGSSKPDHVVPRLKNQALPVLARAGYRVVSDIVAIDVDCPESHRSAKKWESPAPEEWWLEERARFATRLAPWPGYAWYRTWGGYRLVWLLAEPMDVSKHANYCYAFTHALRRAGIQGELRKAWSATSRLPFVNREFQELQTDPDTGEVVKWNHRGRGPEPMVVQKHYRQLRLDADFSGLDYLDFDPEEDLAQAEAGDPLATYWHNTERKIETLPDVIEQSGGTIGGKGRNQTLFSLACSHFKKGMGFDEVRIAVLATNRIRCRPPMEDADVTAIVGNAQRYVETPGVGSILGAEPAVPEGAPKIDMRPPAHILTPAGWDPIEDRTMLERGDEVEIAGRVLAAMEAPLQWRTVYDEGQLWAYDESGIWAVVEAEQVERRVWDMAGTDVLEGTYARGGAPKVRPLRVSNRLGEQTFAIVKKSRRQKGFYADAPKGATFTNGFLQIAKWGEDAELRFGQLDPGWRSRFGYNFDYEPDLKPALFLKTLASTFEGDADADLKIEALREFLGASILGVATELCQALVLLGPQARNGKSTLIYVMQHCFPDGTWCTIPPQEMSKQDRRARLVGKRLNIAGEMPAADITATDKFKEIVSGDPVDARNLYQDAITVVPEAGHLFAANLLPRPRKDFTEGFWRRWMVLTMNNVFRPVSTGGTAVIGLKQKIVRDEIREIVCWAVDSAVTAARRGAYPDIPSSNKRLAIWRREADQVAMFANECLDHSSETTALVVLFKAYSDWAINAGHGGGSKTTLAQRLRTLGFRDGRDGKKNTKFYCTLVPLGVGGQDA